MIGTVIGSMFLMASAPTAQAAPVEMIRTPNGGIQPQAAVDESGVLHLLYYKGEASGGELYYVRRTPGESDFSKPVRVNTEASPAIAAGTIRGAQMALGREGRVHVAWNGVAPKGGTYMEAPMWYTRLDNQGAGFEMPRNVMTFARGLDGGGSVAADHRGNVYVFWHAPKPGNTNGEMGRAVFVARSKDDGATFTPEKLATMEPTGACGCCGMKAFADDTGHVLALFRAASSKTNRDETLLVSDDEGENFKIGYQHGWQIANCPMSSASLSETGNDFLAAAETHGRVFFVRVNRTSGEVSEPISPEVKGKHPALAVNRQGEVLLAWTEGTAWAKGGSLAWQRYDAKGRPLTERQTAEGVPVWSFATAIAKPDGTFAIIF